MCIVCVNIFLENVDVEIIMVTRKCEGEHIYVCEGCILFPKAGDPNDKFTCDGCVITSEIGKTGCNECKESPGVSLLFFDCYLN